MQVELHKLGLALKDTPADFDPSTIVLDHDDDEAADDEVLEDEQY